MTDAAPRDAYAHAMSPPRSRLPPWLTRGPVVAVIAVALSATPAVARPIPEAPPASADDVPPDTAPSADADRVDQGALLVSAPRPILWDPAWGDFSTADWVLTGVAGATAAVAAIIGPSDARWRGGALFDDDARGAIRIDSVSGRRAARDVSDALLTLVVSYPFVVDALIVTGWRRRSPAAAGRVALINLQAFAVVAAIQQLTTLVSGRERPFVQECGGEEDALGWDCDGSARYRSFFSGHTAVAFTAAALTCSHHAHLDLYDDPTADALACGAGLALAAATGVLRVAGDQHYLSDVFVGAAVGVLVGLGLPWLLHYRLGDPTADVDPEAGAGLDLTIVPSPLGAAAIGRF